MISYQNIHFLCIQWLYFQLTSSPNEREEGQQEQDHERGYENFYVTSGTTG